jgi:molecular chaperone GrpE (heat shock protein)
MSEESIRSREADEADGGQAAQPEALQPEEPRSGAPETERPASEAPAAQPPERPEPAPPAAGAGEGGRVKVVDRRFWARAQEGAPEAPVAEEARRPAYVQELEGRLREALETLRRMQAENEAFRERWRRDLDRRVSLAKADLFREILEVADNLERALGHAAEGADAEALGRGVSQVLAQLRRLLEAQGVEEIPVAGELFDPRVAEAVEMRTVEDAALDGRVVEVASRGYRFEGRTLRPARVAVGRR